MSIIIETFLQCDGCFENYGVDSRNRNGKHQRQTAHTEGWVVIKNKDYCPDCKPLKMMSPREKMML